MNFFQKQNRQFTSCKCRDGMTVQPFYSDCLFLVREDFVFVPAALGADFFPVLVLPEGCSVASKSAKTFM